jgi:hypothetical protein
MIRNDPDKEAAVGRVVREVGQADDGQLAGIQADVTKLLGDYERFMGGDLVTYLCTWREAAQRHQARRTASTTLTHLVAGDRKRAS